MLREILHEAYQRHLERSREHGDTWKRMSLTALKAAILLKAERIFWNDVSLEKQIDDGLDLINYVAMFIKRVKDELR